MFGNQQVNCLLWHDYFSHCVLRFRWQNLELPVDSDDLFVDGEKYSSQTIQLISILRLKRKQKSDLSICQTLGLNMREYESIILVGKQKNLFDEKEELTEQAINIIEQIRKKIKFQHNNQVNNELRIEEDMIYIPQKFRGGS
jgi:hypothetical protein